METIYSLKELEAMKTRTRRAIVEKCIEATAEGSKTAAELARACEGLCTKMHIVNGVHGSWSGGYYEAAPGEITRVRRTPVVHSKTHHFAELDDQGNIIRLFDKETKNKVYEYKF